MAPPNAPTDPPSIPIAAADDGGSLPTGLPGHSGLSDPPPVLPGHPGHPCHPLSPDLSPVDLAYSACDGTLINPDYDHVATRVLQNLKDSGASKRQIQVATTQIQRGAIACDWRLGEAECLARLAQATRTEKPYLQTMLLMIRASEADRS
jgi:hypothetical protein